MRLSRIKLSGFKSFVDPTTIHFQSNLTGIVGPNGCGKSNVIDAVRWVMGEMSAKHLRGDSMADVIFNGSSARKPVGSASIELVFDNSDDSIGGQYAGYSEVAIRREVSRDGISNYYLNNTRCRRKDITALFLGTGLGPRAYAIIEQGMISRLVEAKPEELRVFLEEAAGISKFRERRRETENRIRHTRENLERLNDLREEVDKQLRHLDRQRNIAERYKKHKQKERRLGADLLALKLRELATQSEAANRELAVRRNVVEAALAQQRFVENEIEKVREQQTDTTETFNDVQGRYYEVGAEIARLEQSIEHSREMRQRQRQELEQTEQGLTEVRSHIERDEEQIESLQKAISEILPGEEKAQQTADVSAGKVSETEKLLAQWREWWDELTEETGQIHQRAEVERARIEHLESQIATLADRRRKIAAQCETLQSQDPQDEIALLQSRERASENEVAGLERTLAEARDTLEERRREEEQLAENIDARRLELQETRGRLASLEALQDAAVDRETTDAWLQRSGLSEQPRLAQGLKVAPGWERAVETVLGEHLQAVNVDRVDAIAELLEDFEAGALSFIECRSGESGPGRTGTLAEKVEPPWHSLERLSGVYSADTLAEAFHLRARLGPGQSVATRDGIWLGADWLRVCRPDGDESGLISRETEMRELRSRVQTLDRELEQMTVHRQSLKDQIDGLGQQRETEQSALNRAHRARAELQAELSEQRTRNEHVGERLAALEAEIIEIDTGIEAVQESLAETRSGLEQTISVMSESEKKREHLRSRRDELDSVLNVARRRAETDRSAAQQLAIQFESRRSAEDSIRKGLQRLRDQAERLECQQSELLKQLADSEQPLVERQQRLDTALAQSVEVKEELAAARAAVETVNTRLRDLEQQRSERETEVEAKRGELDEVRLSFEEVRVRSETVSEQFDASGFSREEVLSELSEEASVDDWEAQLDRLRSRIERLGAINLAAIEEYDEQSERMQYLDTQLEDLTEALETLESAIRKINRETRTRFKETFDRVDAEFKRLFPRLFGGGHAYLDLSGDDLLSAGITVMARPPGKRNSTIHLLSGGEKALTAVALVFAIFELNPAPFCMLDEVDAPLDDVNIARYCDIVREMSERIQFIFITHNKLTMEIASQLTGVTMQEPGVSRLVAVDVDEAVEMAAV